MLVHGFTGSRDDFTEWLEPLEAAGWQAVAPHLRGHGTSEAPDEVGAYTLDLYAADVLGLADALGWDRFVLLGHSMGGMIAQVVALRAAERLDGLILMDTGHGPVSLDPDLVELAIGVVRGGGMPALLEAQRALAAEGKAPLGTPAHERLLAERPGYGEYGDANLLAASPAMYESMVQAMFEQTDRLDALRKLQVPTLVVVGEQDEPFVKPMARIADAVPGARQVVIPDAGHSPQFENPDAWWAAISDFLADL